MTDKFKDFQDNYFITRNPSETTIGVDRYVTEVWDFDGQYFRKVTENTSATVKIPEQRMSIQEFLTYVDELSKYRDFLIEERPKTEFPRKVA